MNKEMKNTSQKKELTKQELSLDGLIRSIFIGYGPEGTEKAQNEAKTNIQQYLQGVAEKSKIPSMYNILTLYDSTRMLKSDADRIYKSITNFEETSDKPLLLTLYSNGGVIDSAYLIGQLCRERFNKKLVVSVPRQAKSAATLLCCAGDEIHMGSMSELGPIDPQINGLPVLGLKDSIEHIANLVKEIPESAEMFAKYLHYSIKPIDLGYYERVAESAKQYAEKLLTSNQNNTPTKAKDIAHNLVYSYKDHNFVLDKNEAKNIFGGKVVKVNTDEYKFSNSIYSEISEIEKYFKVLNYNFYYIGGLDSKPEVFKKRN